MLSPLQMSKAGSPADLGLPVPSQPCQVLHVLPTEVGTTYHCHHRAVFAKSDTLVNINLYSKRLGNLGGC